MLDVELIEHLENEKMNILIIVKITETDSLAKSSKENVYD